MTVETTLVISVIIFVLFALIFSFMLIYQKVLLEKAATKVAQQGAEMWIDSHKQMENGSFELEGDKDSLYYRIFDDSLFSDKKYTIKIGALEQLHTDSSSSENLQEQKFSKIKSLLSTELCRGFLKPSETTVSVEFSNVLQRKLEIKLTQQIKIPLGFIFKFFGNKGSIELTCKGIGVVTEPTETIRNIDLGIEYGEKISKAINTNELIDKLKGIK